MMYAYIDGDDIGLRIENSFMNNNEIRLKEINELVKEIIEKITIYLKENNHEIIFSGADGIICKNKNINGDEIIEFIRKNSEEINFSIGVGNSLRDAFLALRYAKSSGKNIVAIFNNGFNLVK
ncbi:MULTISPECIES: mCpol domain-containing protein [Clostridium]|uniref:mCpol domain-containing protein n=1 Tax=Clostridium TaxID=1485 RepID=UPI0018A8D40F|nr:MULTISPECIES: mCpol domain-containing protein [Clostridium]MCQ2014615.1 mCpol domain-containing protein [Clostridium butyricum]MCQ2026760.1 mCpol domain-containing protein [Clostridium butyricum]MDB2136765.1 mCpol domain-containing protein [Clostridium butyricum]MDU1115050.1 mCpol domain-containing protein [Clostridium sp.]